MAGDTDDPAPFSIATLRAKGGSLVGIVDWSVAIAFGIVWFSARQRVFNQTLPFVR